MLPRTRQFSPFPPGMGNIEYRFDHSKQRECERIAVEPETESLLVHDPARKNGGHRPADRENQDDKDDAKESFSPSPLLPAFREGGCGSDRMDVKHKQGYHLPFSLNVPENFFENLGDRPEQDLHIETERPVFNVINIVLDAFFQR